MKISSPNFHPLSEPTTTLSLIQNPQPKFNQHAKFHPSSLHSFRGKPRRDQFFFKFWKPNWMKNWFSIFPTSNMIMNWHIHVVFNNLMQFPDWMCQFIESMELWTFKWCRLNCRLAVKLYDINHWLNCFIWVLFVLISLH